MKPLSLTEKILLDHLVDGNELPPAGEVIKIKIDEAFTQDATGTMCMLQLEAMGVSRVKPLSVNFVDHSMLQVGFRNPDDHEYLRTVSQKLGIIYSPAGTGCQPCVLENPQNCCMKRSPGMFPDREAIPPDHMFFQLKTPCLQYTEQRACNEDRAVGAPLPHPWSAIPTPRVNFQVL